MSRQTEYDLTEACCEVSPSLGINLEQFLISLFALSPNQEVVGKTRFQKMIYLLNKHFHAFKDLEFHRDYYGMFSDILEDAFRTLLVHRFVDEWVDHPPELKGKYVIHRMLLEKGWRSFGDLLRTNYEGVAKVVGMVTFARSENYYTIPLKELLTIAYEAEGWTKK